MDEKHDLSRKSYILRKKLTDWCNKWRFKHEKKAICLCHPRTPDWRYLNDTTYQCGRCGYVSENSDLHEGF